MGGGGQMPSGHVRGAKRLSVVEVVGQRLVELEVGHGLGSAGSKLEVWSSRKSRCCVGREGRGYVGEAAGRNSLAGEGRGWNSRLAEVATAERAASHRAEPWRDGLRSHSSRGNAGSNMAPPAPGGASQRSSLESRRRLVARRRRSAPQEPSDKREVGRSSVPTAVKASRRREDPSPLEPTRYRLGQALEGVSLASIECLVWTRGIVQVEELVALHPVDIHRQSCFVDHQLALVTQL